jgi:hypothetical protein
MMNQNVKRLYQAVLLVFISGFLIFIAAGSPIVLNTSDFSIYNTGWNGCSKIAVDTYNTGKFLPTFTYDKTTISPVQKSFTDYELDSMNSTILIIGPQTPFTSDEAFYIEHFLKNGGMLLLADDFGTSNSLLNQINASSRFSNELMLDLSFEKSASFVTIFNINNQSHALIENISGFLLNYPSSLIVKEDNLVLAFSSEMSWIDKNLNGKEDSNEDRGPFCVYAVESYGKGEIILFSGPSLLINSMNDQLDNGEFKNNLLRYLFKGRDTVLIDESHRDISIPFQMGYKFPSFFGLYLKISILLLVVFVFLLLFTSIPKSLYILLLKRFEKLFTKNNVIKNDDPFNMVDEVIEKHPTWNRVKIENIVGRIGKYE